MFLKSATWAGNATQTGGMMALMGDSTTSAAIFAYQMGSLTTIGTKYRKPSIINRNRGRTWIKIESQKAEGVAVESAWHG